jgi:hypothetical protein
MRIDGARLALAPEHGDEIKKSFLSALVGVLTDFGFPGLAKEITPSLQPGSFCQLGRSPNRIDLVTAIDGVTFDEAWSTRETVVN